MEEQRFSAINIIGFSAGLAICLLIVLHVVDEYRGGPLLAVDCWSGVMA